MVFASGVIVDSRYRVVALMGEGGMGTVYSAMHLQFEKMVALKVLKANCLSDKEKVARFRNEARVLSALHHPNVLAVHGIGFCENGQPYIVMDLLTGQSVSDLIRVRGPFAQKDALEIGMQLCVALQYAHEQKVLHRDIKPTNIVVEYDETHRKPHARLVDFGIAKMLDDSQKLTQTGQSIGSLAYLDTQRLEGKPATVQSDIYALGCTFYEMLTGHHPYQADNILELFRMQNEAEREQVNGSEALNAVLARMLSQNPEEQYGSAHEVLCDLTAIAENKPIQHAAPKKRRRWISFKRKSATAAIAVISISCVVAAAWAYNISTPKQSGGKVSALEVENKMLIAHRAKALKQWEQAVDLADEAIQAAEANGDPLLIAEANNLACMIEGFRNDVEQQKGLRELLMDGKTYRRQTEICKAAIKHADEAIAINNDPMLLKRAYAAKFIALVTIAKQGQRRGIKATDSQVTELLATYKGAAGALPKVKENEYLEILAEHNGVREPELPR